MKSPPVQLTPQEIDAVRSWVIYEDEEIIAFNKPSGLSSQGGRIKAHTLDDLTWAFAKSSGNRPRLVHRLDRDTSGVLLAARTQPAAGKLGKALMAHRFSKTYHALVGGAPEPASGTVEAPLRREEIGREAYMRVCAADTPDAQAASTHYRTLSKTDGAALLELHPRTGRMHQIRVHLAHIARPIAGDVRYGGPLSLEGETAPRLMLHAARLSFPHPSKGAMTLTAPWPDDFAKLANSLGLEQPASSSR